MNTDTVIQVRHVSKRYLLFAKPRDRLKQMLLWRLGKNYAREFWALRDLSFEIKRGETVGVIGRNGSGKSTLLQIIAGTLTPTVGQVEVNGRVTALLELGSGFNVEYTGRENVFLSGAILGLSRRDMARRFDEIAAFADIGEFMDQPVKTFSSGMYARLAFAVASHLDPDVLLVDEALSVGDIRFQRKCARHMENLRAGGTTIVLVSHDLHLVERFCSRAVVLDYGLCKADRPSQEAVAVFQDLLLQDPRRTTDPPAVEDVYATGEVEFLEIGLRDAQGQSRNAFRTGEDVYVLTRYRARQPVRDVFFGVSVWASDGTRVGQAHTVFNSPQPYPGPIHGEFEVCCQLKSAALMPGRYTLRGGVYDGQVHYAYCLWGWGAGVGEFNVAAHALNGFVLKDGLGYVLMPSSWSVESRNGQRRA